MLEKQPKYTVADAVRSHEDEGNSVIPFWKTAVNGIKEKYGCFCQWYNSNFSDSERTYSCAEQYMMYKKAMLFNDPDTAQKIMDAKYPGDMQKLGRQIANYDQETWNKYKYGIVYTGNILKFTQNKDIQNILLNTFDNILCEASPYDKIWGIGMEASDVRVQNPKQWYSDAQNLLGFALMEVRDKIKE